jgi:hypothetical protein
MSKPTHRARIEDDFRTFFRTYGLIFVLSAGPALAPKLLGGRKTPWNISYHHRFAIAMALATGGGKLLVSGAIAASGQTCSFTKTFVANALASTVALQVYSADRSPRSKSRILEFTLLLAVRAIDAITQMIFSRMIFPGVKLKSRQYLLNRATVDAIIFWLSSARCDAFM